MLIPYLGGMAESLTRDIVRLIRSGFGTDGRRVYTLPTYSAKRKRFLQNRGDSARVDYEVTGQLLRSIQPALIIDKKGQVALLIRPIGRRQWRTKIETGQPLATDPMGRPVQRTMPRVKGINRQLLTSMLVGAKKTKTAVDIPGMYWRMRGSDGRKAHWCSLPGYDPAKRYGGAGYVWSAIYGRLRKEAEKKERDKRLTKEQPQNRQVANQLGRRLGGGLWAPAGRRATPFIEFTPAQRKEILRGVILRAQQEAFRALKPVTY